MMSSFIRSVGSYLPEKIMYNSDLEKIIDTSNEWIVQRTGIEQRHIAADGEAVSDLAFQAASIAIERSGLSPNDIGGIILATTTSDRIFPSSAVILQKKLNILNNCFAFDISAACSGFLYALIVANNMLASCDNILVVGADKMSSLVDWKDRATCVLFGDGAGAVLLSKSEYSDKGIIATHMCSDGNYSEMLCTSGGISSTGNLGKIQMCGKELFRHAIDKMVESLEFVVNAANMTINDIDIVIPHQANRRITDAAADKLFIDRDKMLCTVKWHANTSAASIPLAIDYAVSNGIINNNSIVALEAVGAGLTWGSLLMRW